MQTYRVFKLENDVEVRLFDRTRNYYGDFHHVLLDVQCEVEIDLSAAKDGLSVELLSSLDGERLIYCRTLDRMGVPSVDVDDVREHLIANFVRHSLPYLSAPFFVERFALAELRKRQKRSAAGMIAIHA